MIYLKRSGSAFTIGHGDRGYLEDVACRALDRGETVLLQIDRKPWREVHDAQEVSDTLDELYEDLEALRDALETQEQLPLTGDGS